jgi:hypothetical protein
MNTEAFTLVDPAATDAPTVSVAPVPTVDLPGDGEDGKPTQDTRVAGGRFGKGNKNGLGNPLSRKTAHLRWVVIDGITDADARQALGVLKDVVANDRPRPEDAARVTAARAILSMATGGK